MAATRKGRGAHARTASLESTKSTKSNASTNHQESQPTRASRRLRTSPDHPNDSPSFKGLPVATRKRRANSAASSQASADDRLEQSSSESVAMDNTQDTADTDSQPATVHNLRSRRVQSQEPSDDDVAKPTTKKTKRSNRVTKTPATPKTKSKRGRKAQPPPVTPIAEDKEGEEEAEKESANESQNENTETQPTTIQDAAAQNSINVSQDETIDAQNVEPVRQINEYIEVVDDETSDLIVSEVISTHARAGSREIDGELPTSEIASEPLSNGHVIEIEQSEPTIEAEAGIDEDGDVQPSIEDTRAPEEPLAVSVPEIEEQASNHPTRHQDSSDEHEAPRRRHIQPKRRTRQTPLKPTGTSTQPFKSWSEKRAEGEMQVERVRLEKEVERLQQKERFQQQQMEFMRAQLQNQKARSAETTPVSKKRSRPAAPATEPARKRSRPAPQIIAAEQDDEEERSSDNGDEQLGQYMMSGARRPSAENNETPPRPDTSRSPSPESTSPQASSWGISSLLGTVRKYVPIPSFRRSAPRSAPARRVKTGLTPQLGGHASTPVAGQDNKNLSSPRSPESPTAGRGASRVIDSGVTHSTDHMFQLGQVTPDKEQRIGLTSEDFLPQTAPQPGRAARRGLNHSQRHKLHERARARREEENAKKQKAEEDQRIAEEMAEEIRAQAPGQKRKRLVRVDDLKVIPAGRVPGQIGMLDEYFEQGSDSDEDMVEVDDDLTTQLTPPPTKKARLSGPSTLDPANSHFDINKGYDEGYTSLGKIYYPKTIDNSPLGDPHRGRPYTGSVFAEPNTDGDGSNLFTKSHNLAKAAQQVQSGGAPNGPKQMSKISGYWTGPRHVPNASITNVEGTFTVPDDSDSDDSDSDLVSYNSPVGISAEERLMMLDYEKDQARITEDMGEDDIDRNQMRSVRERDFARSTTLSNFDWRHLLRRWEQEKKREAAEAQKTSNIFEQVSATATPSPATPKAPETAPAALARARSQAEKYKPKTPSRLAASERLSSSPAAKSPTGPLDPKSIQAQNAIAPAPTQSERPTLFHGSDSVASPAAAPSQPVPALSPTAPSLSPSDSEEELFIPGISDIVWPKGEPMFHLTDEQQGQLDEECQGPEWDRYCDDYFATVLKDHKAEKALREQGPLEAN